MLRHTSSAISLAALPAPALGVPPTCDNPLGLTAISKSVAATEKALVVRLTATAASLHRVMLELEPTGSGSTVTVMVNGSPAHPARLIGVMVYTTSTGKSPVFLQMSSAISVAALPAPALAVPPLNVSPLAFTAMVKLSAATEPGVVAMLIPTTSSLQRVMASTIPTGSGLTVMVTVKAAPWQPAALTGTMV